MTAKQRQPVVLPVRRWASLALPAQGTRPQLALGVALRPFPSGLGPRCQGPCSPMTPAQSHLVSRPEEEQLWSSSPARDEGEEPCSDCRQASCCPGASAAPGWDGNTAVPACSGAFQPKRTPPGALGAQHLLIARRGGSPSQPPLYSTH